MMNLDNHQLVVFCQVGLLRFLWFVQGKEPDGSLAPDQRNDKGDEAKDDLSSHAEHDIGDSPCQADAHQGAHDITAFQIGQEVFQVHFGLKTGRVVSQGDHGSQQEHDQNGHHRREETPCKTEQDQITAGLEHDMEATMLHSRRGYQQEVGPQRRQLNEETQEQSQEHGARLEL